VPKLVRARIKLRGVLRTAPAQEPKERKST
jgi:hypothetical protein